MSGGMQPLWPLLVGDGVVTPRAVPERYPRAVSWAAAQPVALALLIAFDIIALVVGIVAAIASRPGRAPRLARPAHGPYPEGVGEPSSAVVVTTSTRLRPRRDLAALSVLAALGAALNIGLSVYSAVRVWSFSPPWAPAGVDPLFSAVLPTITIAAWCVTGATFAERGLARWTVHRSDDAVSIQTLFGTRHMVLGPDPGAVLWMKSPRRPVLVAVLSPRVGRGFWLDSRRWGVDSIVRVARELELSDESTGIAVTPRQVRARFPGAISWWVANAARIAIVLLVVIVLGLICGMTAGLVWLTSVVAEISG